MGRDYFLYPLICCIVNICGIWEEFGDLSFKGNVVFRRYKNNTSHSVSLSVNGLVTENIPMPMEQDTAELKKPDI